MSDFATSLFSCLLSAVGIGLCIYLFLSLKKEIQALRNAGRELRATMDSDTASVRAEIESLRNEMLRLEQSTAKLPQLASPIPGMNTTRRARALRMHRRGDRPEQIAAALGVARGEIELLLKVQQPSAA